MLRWVGACAITSLSKFSNTYDTYIETSTCMLLRKALITLPGDVSFIFCVPQEVASIAIYCHSEASDLFRYAYFISVKLLAGFQLLLESGAKCVIIFCLLLHLEFTMNWFINFRIVKDSPRYCQVSKCAAHHVKYCVSFRLL